MMCSDWLGSIFYTDTFSSSSFVWTIGGGGGHESIQTTSDHRQTECTHDSGRNKFAGFGKTKAHHGGQDGRSAKGQVIIIRIDRGQIRSIAKQ